MKKFIAAMSAGLLLASCAPSTPQARIQREPAKFEALSSKQRTLVEQGIDGRLVALEGGLPLMAPSGTPEAVLQTLSRAAVDWSNTPSAAKLRESFAIPNKPKNLAETRKDWERDVPVWIKLAVDLGIKLD